MTDGQTPPPLRPCEKIIGNVIPSEARNLALLPGFYVPDAERDSSLRSE
jgi:hypothetical protein